MRAGLAKMGYKSLDEVIGRADLLQQRKDARLSKTQGLDLGFLTTYAGPSGSTSKQRIAAAPHSNGPVVDDVILQDEAIQVSARGRECRLLHPQSRSGRTLHGSAAVADLSGDRRWLWCTRHEAHLVCVCVCVCAHRTPSRTRRT